VEQVEHPLADQHVLPERHRPVLADHHLGLAGADGDQPVGELLVVADRRGQRHQRHRRREVDDDLLPDRAAEPVGQVVHLVHHHVGQAGEAGRARVEHVAQHLGGHHDHRGVAVDRVVAGEQADLVGAVPVHQVVVFLVGERLDRRGVEALAAPGGGARGGAQGQMHGELAHHRLAGAGGRADQHPAAALQGLARPPLEVVQVEADIEHEVVEGRELGHPGRPPSGRRIPFGGTRHDHKASS
jgi:hypothetical protein